MQPIGFLILLALFGIGALPLWIANGRRHKNRVPIGVLCFLPQSPLYLLSLGMIFNSPTMVLVLGAGLGAGSIAGIAWLVAFVWSLTAR